MPESHFLLYRICHNAIWISVHNQVRLEGMGQARQAQLLRIPAGVINWK